MNTLRHDLSFCDVVLQVGTTHMKAHKCVLAAGSPYFRWAWLMLRYFIMHVIYDNII